MFLFSCQVPSSENPTDGSFDLQGHRGARGLLPENSIPGFMHALELGVTTLEMDVVISADSQVVVSHEPWFSSTICSLPSGDPVPAKQEKEYRIFEMSYDEIAAFSCGGRGHPRFKRQKSQETVKPLLSDVIERAEQLVKRENRRSVWYNVEIKSRPSWEGRFQPAPEPFVRLVYQTLVEKEVLDRVVVQSFDMRMLQVMHRVDPSVRLALLVGGDNQKTLSTHIDSLGFAPDVYSPNYRLVNPDLIARAHRRGIEVIPWTVNDGKAMTRLKEMGVDGIITDYPDLGYKLLE